MSSVVYQETNNNFENIGQTIKQKQIPTIMVGTTKVPAAIPDFVGQFYLYIDNDHNPYLSVSYGLKVTDWALVDVTDIPDTVVRDNASNNFTVKDQTILNKQIVTVVQRTEEPKTAPDFIGQLYLHLKQGNTPDLYVSDGNGSPLDWHLVAGGSQPLDPTLYAKLKETNNFEKPQTMNTRPMVTAIINSITPSIKPDHQGQVYIKHDGTANLQMWIAIGTSTPADWKPLTVALGNNVALTDKANNFTEVQTYNNSPLTTVFISGIPPAVKPDYRGQLHFDYNETKTSVEGWVALDNKKLTDWVQFNFEDENLAKLNATNNFTRPQQIMGKAIPNMEWHESPPTMTPAYQGQMYAQFFRDSATQIYKVRMWVAIHVESPKGWCPVQANAPESVNADSSNNFTQVGQTIKGKQIISAIISREGNPPTGTFPDYEGQLYIASKSVGSGFDTQIWIAHFTSTTGGQGVWIPLGGTGGPVFPNECIFKSSNYFENKKQYLGTKGSYYTELIMGARVVDGQDIKDVKSTRLGEIVMLRKAVHTDLYRTDIRVYISLDSADPSLWGELLHIDLANERPPLEEDAFKEKMAGIYDIYDHESPEQFPAAERFGQMLMTRKNISAKTIRFSLWMAVPIRQGDNRWQQIKTWEA